MSTDSQFPSPTKLWHRKAQPAADPSDPRLSAQNKTVLITGGGTTGIGGETARWFARAGAAHLGLLGRREGPLLENKDWIEKNCPDTKVFIQSTDVTDESSVESAFANFAAFSNDGKIDTLVHTAAVIGPKENIFEADPKDYLGSIVTNLQGSLYIARAFVRFAAADAHAIAVNSAAAHLNINDAYEAYCVAKIGMYRLWDQVHFVAPNLNVFHTQPGVVTTEMAIKAGARDTFKDITTDDVSLPASFNLWLSTPEARFLKGKFVWCNWDIDELKSRAEEIGSSSEFTIGLVGWPFDARK